MESYITNKLLKLYPTRVVEKLSSTHASLYRLIGVTAQEKSKNIKEFLEELGFTYVTGHRGISSTFDAITARLLIDEYGISQSDLAQWQGISRQAISSKLSKDTVGTEWITNNLTLEEQVVVKDMIENKLFTIHNENLTIAIRTNYKRVAFIVVNENVTKVVFNFSEEIAQYIDSGTGSIPTAIILAAQEEANLEYSSKNKTISFNKEKNSFLIIDGQHRVWGFIKASTSIRVPVVIYEELTRVEEAQLFVDINSNQKEVPRGLILDVKKTPSKRE